MGAKVKKIIEKEPQSVTVSPVRPGTSAQSAVVPAVFDNEELDHKETDSGLCHHIRVARKLCATETQSLENNTCWIQLDNTAYTQRHATGSYILTVKIYSFCSDCHFVVFMWL